MIQNVLLAYFEENKYSSYYNKPGTLFKLYLQKYKSLKIDNN